MKEQYDYVIDKLSKKEAAGARGFGLCAYLVALEGWRRGLTLKWHNNPRLVTDMKILGVNPIGKTFSLSNNNKTHFFNRSRGDLVTKEAVEICRNKEKTKELLDNANVPVPQGRQFLADTPIQQMTSYAESIGFPVVLKPTTGSLGRGVYANIVDTHELKEAIEGLRTEFNYDEYIIEKFIAGNEYRVYVVNDKVISAVNRIPANITGDGNNTINKLIEIKNLEKKENPYLLGKKIKIDNEIMKMLNKKGYSLDSIPPKGETIYLREKSNVSMGGDPIDATDILTDEVKKVAVNTVKAIPDLYHAGIDVIIDPEDPKKCTVIEVNATAEISMHVFPLLGQARDVPRAIIDFYFPETIEDPSNIKSILHFDYKSINEMLKTRSVSEIEVMGFPQGELYAKKYIATGKVQGVGYRNWVRKKAIELNINGYVKNLENGKVVIVAITPDKEKLSKFKNDCENGPDKARVERINEYNWNQPTKVGFEIRKKSNSEETVELTKALNKEKAQKAQLLLEHEQLQQENGKLLEKYNKIKKQYRSIEKSRSWKLTSPLRKAKFLLKGRN
ncbi:acylphosphatase [Alkalihalobacterium chitinilyticum]|uniref:acylphosphatase n=1 Tax=Alkalihalobacterium chitinilyticum TaxID=2980103 RepID=A0ABT5VK57_9BACI|nr:acylphosphatase [Alkalihalobacterium chitinilyticum]MDE5415821.1 acylphosphatase [Alkalihalobacterium chitinilyticum]